MAYTDHQLGWEYRSGFTHLRCPLRWIFSVAFLRFILIPDHTRSVFKLNMSQSQVAWLEWMALAARPKNEHILHL